MNEANLFKRGTNDMTLMFCIGGRSERCFLNLRMKMDFSWESVFTAIRYCTKRNLFVKTPISEKRRMGIGLVFSLREPDNCY